MMLIDRSGTPETLDLIVQFSLDHEAIRKRALMVDEGGVLLVSKAERVVKLTKGIQSDIQVQVYIKGVYATFYIRTRFIRNKTLQGRKYKKLSELSRIEYIRTYRMRKWKVRTSPTLRKNPTHQK